MVVQIRNLIYGATLDALRHLRSGLGHLASLTLVGAALNFLGQGILARMLDPEQLGRFGNALAIATFLGPVGALGLYGLWQRLFAEKEMPNRRAWLLASLKAVGAVTGGLMLLYTMWGIALGPPEALLFLLMAAHIPARAGQELAGGVFLVDRRYMQFSWIQLWPYAARLPVLYLCAFIGADMAPDSKLLTFAAGHALYAAVVAVICTIVLLRFFKRHSNGCAESLSGGIVSFKDVVSGGMPFLGSTVLATLYGQVSIVIAAQFASYAEAAQFMVANLIVSAGYLSISIVYQRYFQPRMFQLVAEDSSDYAAFVRGGLMKSAAFAAAITCVIWFSSDWIIVPFFGTEYASAVPVLKMLSLAVGLRCLNSHCSVAFVRQADLVYRTRVQFIVLLIALGLMAVGAIAVGIVGVALASIAYELLLFACYFQRARQAAANELQQGSAG